MISCAFSGSGTKAPAFVGSCKAMLDMSEDFSEVAGTSGGSIVAAIIASNHDYYPVLNSLMNADWKQFFPTGIWSMMTGGIWNILFRGGLCDGKTFHKYILDATNHMTFSKAILPVSIIATDIDGGIMVFGKDTPDVLIGDAVRASMSVPFAFEPFKINGHYYVDGGIEDNIPADRLFMNDKKVGLRIAYDISPLRGTISDLSYAGQLITLLMKSTTDAHAKLGAMDGAKILDIDASYASGLDFSMSEEIKSRLYDSGYSVMRNYLSNMK